MVHATRTAGSLRRETAEREAARHASHAPLANSGSTPSDPGFKSNKSFAEVPLFSGKNEQPFQPWTVEFLAPAEVVGDAHDILRELHLKLPDPARAYLNRRYPATGAAQPELREALAYLTSEFGLKYEESILMAGDYKYQRKRVDIDNDVMRALIAARKRILQVGNDVMLALIAARERYYKYQRKRGDTGSDVIRALTAAHERAAGIPAVSDEVEDRYYVFEWNLTAA